MPGAKPLQLAGSRHAPNVPAKPRIVDAGRSPRWWDGEGRKARNSRRTAERAAITLAAFREPERRVTSGEDHCTARFAHPDHLSSCGSDTVNF
jgi:hypothetical protein